MINIEKQLWERHINSLKEPLDTIANDAININTKFHISVWVHYQIDEMVEHVIGIEIYEAIKSELKEHS